MSLRAVLSGAHFSEVEGWRSNHPLQAKLTFGRLSRCKFRSNDFSRSGQKATKVATTSSNFHLLRLLRPQRGCYRGKSTLLAATSLLPIMSNAKLPDFEACYTWLYTIEMNMRPQIPRVTLWIFLVALALTSLALNYPFPQAQGDTVTPAAPTATSVAPAQSRADAGSTDGIVLVAVIIVLIVILSILFRRKDWENGKRQK